MVLLKKPAHLVLKIASAMMRLLLFDIPNQRPRIGWSHREGPVPTLPCKPRELRPLLLHPLRRTPLDLLQYPSHADGRMQPHREVNMISHTPNPQAVPLPDLPREHRQIRMQSWPQRLSQHRSAPLRTEDHMDQHERERLRHSAHLTHVLRPRPSHLRTIALLALSTLAPAQAPKPAPPHPAPHITIRILNARTNKPITDERLNISLRADQPGGGTLPTDKNGLILVDTGDASTVRILSNMYADCRPRAELYTNYPIATIRSSGISTGNLCGGHLGPAAKPGELLLYEIPRTYIPTYPHPPAGTLPHSDENPNVPGPPPTH